MGKAAGKSAQEHGSLTTGRNRRHFAALTVFGLKISLGAGKETATPARHAYFSPTEGR
jgi:hypothetical protein